MCRRLGFAVVTVLTVLTVLGCGSALARASRMTERNVTFHNSSVELHGTLILPVSEKPCPAVVFLHGSGPHARAGFRPYAEEFAQLGLASLFYDKRGSGESGGSWVTSSLEDLADDAVAAVRFLEDQDGVDPKRIGFWGVSQAGWVAPLAAARSGDIAFMVLISGGGASPHESESFSYDNEFQRAGLTEAESDTARTVLAAYFDYLSGAEPRADALARLDAIRGGRLDPLAEQLDRILPSETNRANWSWVANYDPQPWIEKLTCPILLMFGDQDREHPTELAVERWKQGLTTAGDDDVTIVVFPGAGHGIRMREGHHGEGRAPFADGYAEVQLGWLWQHVLAGAR